MRTSSGLRYRVYLDSHLIWNPQLTVFLPKTFLYSLEKLRDLAKVDVRIPRIAADELIYQKSQLLQKQANQLRHIKKQVNLVTTASFDEVPDDATLQQLLKRRFDSYLAQHRINIVEPSVRTIDWSRVIFDSTWRQPPFATFTGEKAAWESGFRDRIIIETFLHDLTTADKESVVFISPDANLRLAVKQRLEADQKVLFFENFRQLVDHSTLLERDFSDEQIQEFQSIADDHFTNAVISENLYSAEVRQKLLTQADPYLQKISPADFATSSLQKDQDSILAECYPTLNCLPSEALKLWALRDWSPLGSAELIPQRPTLEKIQIDGKLAHLTWRTPILIARPFIEAGRDARLSALLNDIAIKATGFSIYWNIALRSEKDTTKVESQAISEIVHDGFERVLLRPESEILHQLLPSFTQNYLTEPTDAFEELAALFETSKKPA